MPTRIVFPDSSISSYDSLAVMDTKYPIGVWVLGPERITILNGNEISSSIIFSVWSVTFTSTVGGAYTSIVLCVVH